MVTNKIKSLLSYYGFVFADYARYLSIKPQSLNTKAKKDAYKIDELIKLAEMTNTKLAFLDEINQPIIIFSNEDIKE